MRQSLFILSLLLIYNITFSQGVLSNTQGFSFNLFGKYNNWKSNSNFLGNLDDSEPNGTSIGLRLGYGFTENIKIFASHEFSNYALKESWNTYTINTTELGLRYSFAASLNKFRPYIQVAVARCPLNIDPVYYEDDFGNEFFDVKLKAGGYSFGGAFGVQYYITPDLNLDLGFGGNFGNFSELYIDGFEVSGNDEDVDFRILFLSLGVSYSIY